MPESPHLKLLPPDAPEWPPVVERFILPYVQDSRLYVVTLAVMLHVVLALILLLLPVLREANPFAMLALFVIGTASARAIWEEVRRLRRPGAFTVVLVLTWAASVAGALALRDTIIL